MPHRMSYGDEIISLNDVKIMQENFVVLDHVNLQIKRGEFHYLIGKTGAGKSSLLKVLYGDLQLKHGSGEVVGFDLKKLRDSDIPALRRRLGIVFQDFQLLTDRNVEKNLLFVLKATGWKNPKQIEDRIHEVLESVNMLSKMNKMPHELSGGEQQRIAIARALLNHPELILADEPTGNLDPETSNEIMTLLNNISKLRNCAVLMATHDYHMLQNFPGKAIKCENTSIVSINTEELFDI